MIESSLYKQIMENMPIFCVDIILKFKGKYLLLKRANQPLKDYYFLIGGRVLKNESVWEAATRKVKEEIGCDVSDLRLVGIYEDMYAESAWGVSSHTISAVFEATTNDTELKLDEQSKDYILSDELPQRFEHKMYRI